MNDAVTSTIRSHSTVSLLRTSSRVVTLSLLIQLLFGATLASSQDVDDRVEAIQATQNDLDFLNKRCKTDLAIGEDDLVFVLKYNKLYRSSKHCTQGKRREVCETYAIHIQTGTCWGMFLSGGSIVDGVYDTSDPDEMRQAQDDAAAPLPKAAKSKTAEPLMATDSVNGAIFLLETEKSFDVIEMKW